ncbi:hypothetical protein [Medusavirus stheno T3]|uniref:Uncharacterized protein n=1 Tax=Medusavirus stheno T3 TaxID=3069717 RepID=A0A7S7YG62_9VIRU|nr:hypothetical protein QKU73_gp168 [Acanthamoeba castellanii medusavirus]QPB44607.1 hypothetical protein [Medusavirus stheno T3]
MTTTTHIWETPRSTTIATAYNGLLATLVGETDNISVDTTYSEGKHVVVFRIVRCVQPWLGRQPKCFGIRDAESRNSGMLLTYDECVYDGDLVGIHIDMAQRIATVSVNGVQGAPTKFEYDNAKILVVLSNSGVRTAEIVPHLCNSAE